MKRCIIVFFSPADAGNKKRLVSRIESLSSTHELTLLVWSDFHKVVNELGLDWISRKFGPRIYGLMDGGGSIQELIKSTGPDLLHFSDIPEKFMNENMLLHIFGQREYQISESVGADNQETSTVKFIPDKFIFEDTATLQKFLPIAKDFDMESDFKGDEKPIKANQRAAIVVTFYRTNLNRLDDLRRLLKSLSFSDWFVLLATHSAVPEDIQELCDLVVFEQENIADQRKYSHGVAETSLIRKSFATLKGMGFEWSFKICYDVEIDDISTIRGWTLDHKYQFVSCQWGHCTVSTNSFFANIDFVLSNFTFFDSIEGMFTRSFFIEDIWDQDIRSKGLEQFIFTYPSKESMFKTNRMDTRSFVYESLVFRFDESEIKFYIDNPTEEMLQGRFSIVDYYTELAVYVGDIAIVKGSVWVAPNEVFLRNKLERNGYYLEITGEQGEELARRNLNISDFRKKHPMHKAHKRIRKSMTSFTEETLFPEFARIHDNSKRLSRRMSEHKIESFVDSSPDMGVFALWMLNRGCKKAFLFEKDGRRTKALSDAIGTNWISVLVMPEDRTVKGILSTQGIPEKTDMLRVVLRNGEYEGFVQAFHETMHGFKCLLLQYHSNKSEMKNVVKTIAENGYGMTFEKWDEKDSDEFLSNESGYLFAYK
jgi:hypothetical protein